MKPHEIIKSMHEAFPKVVRKLSLITGKSEEWFHSHGREPRSSNPLQSGNKSPVTAYIEYLHQNEAAERGAGMMLNARVYASMCAEFQDPDETEQAEHFDKITDEICDVQKWLNRFKIEDATPRQLAIFDAECGEAIESIMRARAKARSVKRQKGLRVAA